MVDRHRLLLLVPALCAGVLSAADVAPPPAPAPAREPWPALKDTPTPMKAEDTMQFLDMAPGLEVTLVAGEPAIVQPKGLTFDAQGRLWVLQDVTYNGQHYHDAPFPSGPGVRSAVLIFTDADRDGVWEKRDVFLEMDEIPSCIAVGGGFAYIGIGGQVVRFAVKPGDTKAGAGEVVIAGFKSSGAQGQNGLVWGPDGWLYGGQGGGNLSGTKIIAPAVPWTPGMDTLYRHNLKSRTPAPDVAVGGAGVWRFNPECTTIEWFARGTSNVWGLDFDAWGEAHSVTTVSDGPWQWIQGGCFDPQNGPEGWVNDGLGDYTYEWMPSTRIDARVKKETMLAYRTTGGPPGAPPGWKMWNITRPMGGAFMFGDVWPEAYRDHFASTALWEGAIMTEIKYEGSTSVSWWEGVRLIQPRRDCPPGLGTEIFKDIQGPDQAIYLLDWAETARDKHLGAHKFDGRIYRMAPKGLPQCPAFDLDAETDAQLIERAITGQEWFSRMARVVLAGRARAGTLAAGTIAAAKARWPTLKDTTPRLRCLWLLHGLRGDDDAFRTALLKDSDERLRAWAIQLSCEAKTALSDAELAAFVRLAGSETSPVVRRYLGSAVLRLPVDQARQVVLPLIGREEDGTDKYLTTLYWYGVERLISDDKAFATPALAASKHAKLRTFIARRLVDPGRAPKTK